MFPNAEMQVLSRWAVGLEISRRLEGQRGFVRWTEVRRSTDEPWNILCEHIKRFTGSVPSRNTLGIGRKNRKVTIPSHGEFAPLHQFDFLRQIGILGSI